MQFIYQYPETSGPDPDMVDVGSVSELAVAAEQAGWGGFSLTEHPAPGSRWLNSGGHQSLDPFIALGHAAAVTERIRLLTYLTVVPYRNPLLLAKSAATVDKLSNGRFILGVGTGYLKGEFHALGADFDERNAAFDEALDVLPLHWSGEPFDYEGRDFSARSVQARPRPVQQPIPIWIGGNAKVTRRRVAERAQGWMPLGGSADLLRTTRTPSLGSAEDLAARIAEVKEMAGARASELSFAMAYHDDGFTTVPSADAERHKDALGRLEAAGLTHVIASGGRTVPEASVEWIHTVGDLYLTT
jgi:probable F420-dependent oxidoreductase